MPALLALLRVADTISAIALGAAMVLALVLIGTTCYEVAARYLFNAPTLWAFDAATMLNGAVFMLATAYTLRMKGHVQIDFLSEKLPPRVQRGIVLLLYLLVLLPALGWVVWSGSIRTWTAFVTWELERVSAWRPVVWPFYFTLLAGFVCLWLQVLAESIRHVIAMVEQRAS